MFDDKRNMIGLLFAIAAILIMIGCAATLKPRATTFLQPHIDPEIQVDIYIPGRTWEGTTLFADYHDPGRTRIVEVNMVGQIVWEYVLPVDMRRYTNPGFDAKALPNKNVLFVSPCNGVFEINPSGDFVWSYSDKKVSHDADRLDNGNTLVVWGGGDRISDAQVKEINPKGEIVWSWYAKDNFNRPPFDSVQFEGWTHTNGATRLPNGNTLISMRNFDLTVEVNSKGSVLNSFSWRKHGRNPHSPTLLPNGNLLVALRGPHRVIEVEQKSGRIVWQFDRSDVETVRDVDRLPNGNTLIVERTKILEVAPSGEIVWQLKMKTVGVGPRDKERWLYTAQRVPRPSRQERLILTAHNSMF